MSSFEEVLEYWFGKGTITPKEAEKRLTKLWFANEPKIDAQLADKFSELREQALRDELDVWCASARGRLALILMLDPFSRRIYRGTSQAYSGDVKALKLCRQGIAEGADRALPTLERCFFYLPLVHAEQPNAQLASVRLYKALAEESPQEFSGIVEGFLDDVERHAEVIERFERFPQRNEVLRRETSRKERDYLKARRTKLRA